MAEHEPGIAAQPGGQCMDRRDAHILGGAAARADGVVVGDLLDLEARDAVPEPHLLEEPRPGEIGQHPVDGGAVHLAAPLAEPQPDVVGAQMGAPGSRDDGEDGEALGRGPEPGDADRLPGRRVAVSWRLRGGRPHRRSVPGPPGHAGGIAGTRCRSPDGANWRMEPTPQEIRRV
jgi:hypothetical protein